MHKVDAPGHLNNEFSDGNPLTGQEATMVDAAFMNAIMYEIINVILFAEMTLEKGTNTQLRDAIISIATGGGSSVAASGVSIDDAAGYFSGLLNVEEALQALGEFMQSGTFAAARSRREVLQLTGAAHLLVAGHYERIIEISHGSACTYTVRADADVAFPIGGTITIFQAGGGQVEIVQAAGVTVQKGASFTRKTLEQHSSVVLVKVAANTWRMGGIMEAAA
jgi:hypothetical protein